MKHIIVFILKITQAKHGIPKCNTLICFSNPYSDKELKVPKHRVMGKTRTTTCGSVQSIRKLKIQSFYHNSPTIPIKGKNFCKPHNVKRPHMSKKFLVVVVAQNYRVSHKTRVWGGKHWWTTIRYGFNLWGMHGLARIFLAVLLKATTCSKRETTNKSGILVKLRFSFLSFSARDMCQTMSTNARASLYIFRTIMYLLTNPHPSIKVIKVLFLIINFPYVFRLETNIIHLLVHFR